MAATYYNSGGTQYVNNYQLPNGTYYSGPVSGIPTSTPAPTQTSTPAPAPTTPAPTQTSTPAPTQTAGTKVQVKLPDGRTLSGTLQGNGSVIDNNGEDLIGKYGGTLVSSTPASTPASTLQPPSVNLQPGDTGAQVKQLQDYLVSKGLMTQAQVNTGYGTYGPQTTAAVAALQKSLGVDNSTGVGYFGPRTIAAIGTTSTTGSTGSTGTTGGTVDPELLKILSNPTLSPDQKAVIQGIFGAVSNNDADTAAKIQAAMKAASEFSDPYFKAQIQLATDALTRGISGKEGDLAFAEKQQQAALDKLTADTTASKDQLSFQHAQELQQLQQKYETDLATTQDNLASAGFTSSSKRARAENILNTNNTGLVESSNKQFGYQTGNLDRTLAANQVDTQATIANLQRLAAAGKLDSFRTTEQAVGSANLPSVDGLTPVGNVGGTIPRQQALDSFSFASNFVF